jgi:hypothetical protein
MGGLENLFQIAYHLSLWLNAAGGQKVTATFSTRASAFETISEALKRQCGSAKKTPKPASNAQVIKKKR